MNSYGGTKYLKEKVRYSHQSFTYAAESWGHPCSNWNCPMEGWRSFGGHFGTSFNLISSQSSTVGYALKTHGTNVNTFTPNHGERILLTPPHVWQQLRESDRLGAIFSIPTMILSRTETIHVRNQTIKTFLWYHNLGEYVPYGRSSWGMRGENRNWAQAKVLGMSTN